jgi:hypothetical protein
MTLGRPLVSPVSPGCHVPGDPGQRTAGPSPGAADYWTSGRWQTGSVMKHWKIAGLISVPVVCAAAIFALDNGIYVGSKFYIRGATCCPDSDEIVKHCEYFFVTGVSELPAANGTRISPGARKRNEALVAGKWPEPDPERDSVPVPPDQGFCRLFGSSQAAVEFLTR